MEIPITHIAVFNLIQVIKHCEKYKLNVSLPQLEMILSDIQLMAFEHQSTGLIPSSEVVRHTDTRQLSDGEILNRIVLEGLPCL